MCDVFLFMVGIPAHHLLVAFEMNFVLGVPFAALRSGFSLQVLVPLPAALRAFRCNPSRGHQCSNVISAYKHHIAVIPAQAGISSMEINANTDSRLRGNDVYEKILHLGSCHYKTKLFTSCSWSVTTRTKEKEVVRLPHVATAICTFYSGKPKYFIVAL